MRSVKSGRAACALIAFLAVVDFTIAQSAFPFDRDLVLDARAMRGGKRLPVLAIGPDGRAQIDLWCKRGQGQAVDRGRDDHDRDRRDER